MKQDHIYLRGAPRFLSSLIICLICLLPLATSAAWFEATGQAAIERGDKEVARQRATQEAIRQALLFAGASVKSVQQMANGLLQEERLEVRASGEVNKIELIDEVYADGYVTVSIRADIFPQDSQCDASDYTKTLVTTWFPLKDRQQAATGGLYHLGEEIALRIQYQLYQFGNHAKLKQVEPYAHEFTHHSNSAEAMLLAQKVGSQFVLMGYIHDISMELSNASSFAFWKDKTPIRHFAMSLSLVDGVTGAQLMTKEFVSSADWEFALNEAVDVRSQRFWSSDYGREIDAVIRQVSQDIDEAVRCEPAYGKVLRVNRNQVQVDIGSNQGVKSGDMLTLFKMNQFYDPTGTVHQQYQLYPTKMRVSQVFPDSALLIAEDDSYLANIQPNDFVVRR